jgi:hypothetical protein
LNLSAKTTTTLKAEADETPHGFWATWRWWLPPALIALALALYFVDPFIGDWDGLDYTVNALHGSPSTMALGRFLFIYANHALWLIAHKLFHLQAEQAYLLFKYAVVAQSPLAAMACWQLARDLTRSVHAATIAALLVAFSPIFVIYSGQVMTDVPSLLIVSIALIIHLRGLKEKRVWLVLLGAAILGAGVNVRETVAFYAPWLVIAPFVCGWRFSRREIFWTLAAGFIFLVLAITPFALWYAMDVNHYRAAWHGWRESMRAEVARHPVELRNLIPFLLFFFALSPLTTVALPVAGWQEWRGRKLSPLLLMALVGLFANFLLFFNYSTVINWRYFLTGLPALVPLVADYFLRSQIKMMRSQRRAFWSVVAGIIFVAIMCSIYLKPVSSEHIIRRAETKNYHARLSLLPRDAVVIAGGQTIAVDYWRGIGAGEWVAIGTGGGWPGDNFIPLIESHLNAGRRVFLDADARWWSPCGWQKDETLTVAALETRFRFRQVSDTIFEIRPLDDEQARDAPQLQTLLPENRQDELKKCSALGKSS